MITLLALIFIGQSVASSVMIYSMSNMSMSNMQMTNSQTTRNKMTKLNGSMHNMQMMNHSNMAMSSENNNDNTDVQNSDCCKIQCQCFASGCSTAATLSPVGVLAFCNMSSSKISSQNSLIPNQALTSLLRPPILS